MNSGPVDLTSCDREPIHLIGAIQPYGTLLAINQSTQTIDYCAANTDVYFGRPAEQILDAKAVDVLGSKNFKNLMTRSLEPGSPAILRPWFPEPEGLYQPKMELECLPHLHDDLIILEFLQNDENSDAVWEQEELRQRIISELIRPDALEQLAEVSAEIIRTVTGFDRVMIYKFAEDKHGEVIAESTTRSDRFLGLHYPASDIPDPARRHFVLNVIRTIPDINAKPVPVITRSGAMADASSPQPVDLTFSKLRAVAPVHIEYLNNMGVEASLSISLITNNELWGLVACHHYSKRFLPSNRLRFIELLGGTISALLQSMENTNKLQKSIDAEKLAFRIEQRARQGDALADVILGSANELMTITDSGGIVLKLGEHYSQAGTVPEPTLEYEPLRAEAVDGVGISSHLSKLVKMDALQHQVAAGAAYLELSEDGDDYLVLLRRHYVHTIKWAGKPDKLEQTTMDGTTRLSPRGSFALWSEERKGTSRPFDSLDLEAFRIIRRAIFALNSLERERMALKAQHVAEAEEARLRHALLDASRNHAMSEVAAALAHELNQPLSAVANYVNACRQELRNSGIEISDRAEELMKDAVAETTRAGDLVRRVRDFVARGDLAADYIDINATVKRGLDLCFMTEEANGVELKLCFAAQLPPVWADAVQIAQVVLNIAKNSLASMRDEPSKLLSASTRLCSNKVEISIRDTGHGLSEDVKDTIFEPFHASTTSGMGIGLSLCRSIVQAHAGKIWVTSLPDGTEMTFTLPITGNGDGRPTH